MSEDKKYKETRIYTTTSGAEAVSAMLLGFGVDGVSIEDKSDIEISSEPALAFEPDFGDETIVRYYTVDDVDGDAVIAAVKEGLMKLKANEQYGDYGSGADFGRLYSESVAIDNEWKTKWKDYFRPFVVADRFLICPPWEVTGSADSVIIDPGMAFGTGSHETTTMCVESIVNVVDMSTEMLDIGTGSGILSIIAAKCGARSVTAIDIDEDALRSASENIGRNGVANIVRLIKGDITVETVRDLIVSANGDRGFDIISANLTSGLLKTLMPAAAKLLADGGKLIMSGILETERDDILKVVSGAGMKVYLEETRGEWLLLCADF